MCVAFQFINEQTSLQFFFSEMDRLAQFCYENYGGRFDNLCVGVSGGADSLALLFMSKQWAEQRGVRIFCVTVDHQLRPESLDEALFVRGICDGLQIPHSTLTWKHDTMNIPHSKLENLAREARYSLLSQFCKQHNISVLMTGHHWNDQLETYAIRQGHNSSSCGLAGMSQVRSLTEDTLLVRPLLHFSKMHLKDWMITTGHTWKEDPMNSQNTFLRTHYRNKLREYSTETINEISDIIFSLGRQRTNIESSAVEFLKRHCEFSLYGYAVMDLQALINEQASIQCEIMKRAIWNIGGKKYPPMISDKLLSGIFMKTINTVGKCLIQIKNDRVFVFREARNIESIEIKKYTTSIRWDDRFLIHVNSKLIDCVVSSSHDLEDTSVPKRAYAGYPSIYKNGQRILCKQSCDIVFLNKVNLFDVFV